MRCVMMFIALAGGMFSFSVIVEVLEKLVGGHSPTWSALKLMGPQAWIPIDGDPKRMVVALAILVFSMLYFASCWILDRADTKENPYLVLPWILCEACSIIYQCCAAVNIKERITRAEGSLLLLDSLVGMAAIGYVSIAAISWMQRASSRRDHHDSEDDVEMRICHTHVTPGAPEGKPLLKDGQQRPKNVSEIAPKPWKPVEASLFEKLALMEMAGGKRGCFRTRDSKPIKEGEIAQPTPHEKKSLPADISDNGDDAVLSSIGENRVVGCVKPSDMLLKTDIGYNRHIGNRSIHSVTANGSETNRHCTAEDCDYWPCNESTLPTNRSLSADHLESCTRPSLAERMYCQSGSCSRAQEFHAKENIRGIPKYAKETIRNLQISNIYISIREARGGVGSCGVSSPQIQKLTNTGGLKSSEVSQSTTNYIDFRELDSFIETDSFARSRNRLNGKSEAEISMSNVSVMCQRSGATMERPSPVRVGPPREKRPGNFWMYTAPEYRKRSLLSGGMARGYMYSASDMDLTAFAPKCCAYQRSSPSIGNSARDSGGVVLQRMLAPTMELVRSNSSDCSISDLGPNKFVYRLPALPCPSLPAQSRSSLPQTTLEFSEEYMQQKTSPAQHSKSVPTVAFVDNKMEYKSSRYKRGHHSLEQKCKKAVSYPGFDASEVFLVDNVRTIAKRFPPSNLKRSEHWSVVGEMDSSTFTHALNKSSDIVTSIDKNKSSFHQNGAVCTSK